MRKLFVKYSTGYCGMDGYDLIEFPEDESDEIISEELYYQAVEHASQYGIEMCSDDCDDEECMLEHPGSSNIEAYWEEYDSKKHDGYLR